MGVQIFVVFPLKCVKEIEIIVFMRRIGIGIDLLFSIFLFFKKKKILSKYLK